MVIWLSGLSGSGKTLIGRRLLELWKVDAPNTVIVDGDDVRDLLAIPRDSNSYTMEGRRRVAERICDICAWLDHQNINVVCCTMSFFDDLRQRNRKNLSAYFEVYIDVPLEVLYRRDDKDLYAPALRGEIENVIGVNLPFTPPAHPDLVIDNSLDGADLDALAVQILDMAKPA